jgi:hypothetical protein
MSNSSTATFVPAKKRKVSLHVTPGVRKTNQNGTNRSLATIFLPLVSYFGGFPLIYDPKLIKTTFQIRGGKRHFWYTPT